MNNDKNYSSVRSVFCNFLFSLRYMWKNAKLYTVLQLTGMLTEGLYPSANLLLTALLFNSLEEDRDFKTAFRILNKGNFAYRLFPMVLYILLYRGAYTKQKISL